MNFEKNNRNEIAKADDLLELSTTIADKVIAEIREGAQIGAQPRFEQIDRDDITLLKITKHISALQQGLLEKSDFSNQNLIDACIGVLKSRGYMDVAFKFEPDVESETESDEQYNPFSLAENEPIDEEQTFDPNDPQHIAGAKMNAQFHHHRTD